MRKPVHRPQQETDEHGSQDAAVMTVLTSLVRLMARRAAREAWAAQFARDAVNDDQEQR